LKFKKLSSSHPKKHLQKSCPTAILKKLRGKMVEHAQEVRLFGRVVNLVISCLDWGSARVAVASRRLCFQTGEKNAARL
jgi:hypothetical protein